MTVRILTARHMRGHSCGKHHLAGNEKERARLARPFSPLSSLRLHQLTLNPTHTLSNDRISLSFLVVTT